MKVSQDFINKFRAFKNKIAKDDLASLMTAFHLSGAASQELKVLIFLIKCKNLIVTLCLKCFMKCMGEMTGTVKSFRNQLFGQNKIKLSRSKTTTWRMKDFCECWKPCMASWRIFCRQNSTTTTAAPTWVRFICTQNLQD